MHAQFFCTPENIRGVVSAECPTQRKQAAARLRSCYSYACIHLHKSVNWPDEKFHNRQTEHKESSVEPNYLNKYYRFLVIFIAAKRWIVEMQ